MTRTVDLVIAGNNAAAAAAAAAAIGRGLRVLVVIRPARSGFARQLRHVMGTAKLPPQQLTVLTGSEVACIDGVNSVEAVVVRRLRTRRLIAFNASALLVFDQRARNTRSFSEKD